MENSINHGLISLLFIYLFIYFNETMEFKLACDFIFFLIYREIRQKPTTQTIQL